MHLKKVWIPATIAMMLVLPAVGAFAELPGSEQTPPAVQEGEKYHKGHQGKGDHHKYYEYHHGMKISIHKEAYYLLLAEKHTPGDLEQWKTILSERKSLMKEFKELGFKDKVKQGEISKEQLMERHKEWKEKSKSIRDQRQAIRQEFTTAIESNDSKQIAVVLPKLLEQIQKDNQGIKAKLSELKSLTEKSKNKGQ